MIYETIKMRNGDEITYRETSGDGVNCRSIQKTYFDNGNISKTIILSMGDDYGFEGCIENASIQEIKNATKVQFDFNEHDILYMYLERLLGEQDILIIDDDETWGKNKKTMQVYRTDTGITIAFENKLPNNKTSEKFRVFIKNILFDNRSKVDYYQYDTKERLARFFAEIRNQFLQINQEKDDEER